MDVNVLNATYDKRTYWKYKNIIWSYGPVFNKKKKTYRPATSEKIEGRGKLTMNDKV